MNYDRPIPLRPAPDAVFATALRSLSRAAVVTARKAHDPHTRNLWRDDADMDLILRAASTPTSTTNTAALTTIKQAFISALMPVSAASRVIAASMQLNFDGALQIGFPTLTLPQAKWISESAPIPVVSGNSAAGPRIDPYKLGVIVSATNELLNSTNAESAIRQLLIENCAPALDQAMFSSGAGTPGLQPPGLLHNITPITAANPGSPADGMIADLKSLARALAPASGAGTPLLIVPPDQAVTLSMAVPRDIWSFVVSPSLPAGTVIGLVPAALVTAIESPRLDASGEVGELHMEDSAPAEIVSGSGVFAKPVISVFQKDSVALRLIMPASWALRSPSGLAWIQGANW